MILVLVGGLPGTGKSTLAAGLAERHGWAVLRSDQVRKEMAGSGEPAAGPDDYRRGRYSPQMTERTYRALLDGAIRSLSSGRSVILDASWSSAGRREEAAAIARQLGARLVALRCEAPREVAEARISARAERGTDPSDATPQIARAMTPDFDPWPKAWTIDTSSSPEAALAAANELVAAARTTL